MAVTTHTRRRRFWLALLFELGLGALAIPLGVLLRYSPLATIHGSLFGVTTGVLATIPLVGILFVVWRGRAVSFRKLRRNVRRMVRGYFGRLTVIEAAALSVAAGVGEELLFRGLLQGWLADISGMPWLAIVPAALLFGAVHSLSRLYFLYATLLGAVLGAIYVITGDLLAPIICHAAYDTVALLLSQSRSPMRRGSARRALPRRDRRPPGERADRR